MRGRAASGPAPGLGLGQLQVMMEQQNCILLVGAHPLITTVNTLHGQTTATIHGLHSLTCAVLALPSRREVPISRSKQNKQRGASASTQAARKGRRQVDAGRICGIRLSSLCTSHQQRFSTQRFFWCSDPSDLRLKRAAVCLGSLLVVWLGGRHTRSRQGGRHFSEFLPGALRACTLAVSQLIFAHVHLARCAGTRSRHHCEMCSTRRPVGTANLSHAAASHATLPNNRLPWQHQRGTGKLTPPRLPPTKLSDAPQTHTRRQKPCPTPKAARGKPLGRPTHTAAAHIRHQRS